jgi:hypothetical protein
MPKPPAALPVMSAAPSETINLEYVHQRATSVTGAAAALASALGRRPAEAGATISWLPGRRRSPVRWRAPATRLRLDRKCGRGGCFDLMIGRLALYRETAASVLAEFSLSANT